MRLESAPIPMVYQLVLRVRSSNGVVSKVSGGLANRLGNPCISLIIFLERVLKVVSSRSEPFEH
jgi:F0F1-type ATP synthase assembly protein I